MTTTFGYPKRYSRPHQKNAEPLKLSLFSPMALLILVTVVFTFFVTASGGQGYLRTANQPGSAAAKEKKPDPVIMYQKIVTNADAIRSVLQ